MEITRVLSIINLKGGVGKTISAINIAFELSTTHEKRVLLIDNDKQGNTSRFFGMYSYDAPSISDVLLVDGYDILDAVQATEYANLSVLPANMDLLHANDEIMRDCSRVAQTRLREALERIDGDIDFVVIDNPPDLGINVYNALVASDDILIPIKIDSFAFDGVDQVLEAVKKMRGINNRLTVVGGFVTMLQSTRVNKQGAEILHAHPGLPMMKTAIRKTARVDETTFTRKPLALLGSRVTAGEDYRALVNEYISIMDLC